MLLSLVADPAAMARHLTRKDRARLQAVADIVDPDHEVWRHVEPTAADRARLAMVSLVREGHPRVRQWRDSVYQSLSPLRQSDSVPLT